MDIEIPNTLCNLSEPATARTLLETFKKAINALTVQDMGDAKIHGTIKLCCTRLFVVKDHSYPIPRKSVFNRIIGVSNLELRVASFQESCTDVGSYAKNYLAVNFKLDYVKADGNISNYYPDFLVKLADNQIVIVETKGLEDPDVPRKIQHLKQRCEDINQAQSNVTYDFVFVDEKGFHQFTPSTFQQLMNGFQKYQGI